MGKNRQTQPASEGQRRAIIRDQRARTMANAAALHGEEERRACTQLPQRLNERRPHTLLGEERKLERKQRRGDR